MLRTSHLDHCSYQSALPGACLANEGDQFRILARLGLPRHLEEILKARPNVNLWLIKVLQRGNSYPRTCSIFGMQFEFQVGCRSSKKVSREHIVSVIHFYAPFFPNTNPALRIYTMFPIHPQALFVRWSLRVTAAGAENKVLGSSAPIAFAASRGYLEPGSLFFNTGLCQIIKS